MRTKKKEAKFFCESCGNEVPRNAKTCPSCGKFFASVRCPKCFATGTNDDFKNGCPRCGYAINPDSLGRGSGFTPGFGNANGKGGKKSTYKKNNFDFSIFTRRKNSSYNADSSLPIWVYVFTVVVLIVLVICLYSCL